MPSSSCRAFNPAARRIALRSHCRPKIKSKPPTTTRMKSSGRTVNVGPRRATTTPSATTAAPTPPIAEDQRRVIPTARTIASASTASTAQATNTVSASPASAPLIPATVRPSSGYPRGALGNRGRPSRGGQGLCRRLPRSRSRRGQKSSQKETNAAPLLRRSRPWSGPLESRPANIALAIRPLCSSASPDAEQPLGPNQVSEDGQVDQEGRNLERGDGSGQLEDLQGQQQRRCDERQVLSPATLVPEPQCLDPLYGCVEEQSDSEQVQGGRLQGEQLVQVVNDSGMAGLHRPSPNSALDIGEDTVEAVLQFVLVRGDEKDKHREESEHGEVNGSIDRDGSQNDLVAQGTAAQRHGDLLKGRKIPQSGVLGRREREPTVAAKATVPSHPVAFANDDRVLWANLGDVGAGQLVATVTADEDLALAGSQLVEGFGPCLWLGPCGVGLDQAPGDARRKQRLARGDNPDGIEQVGRLAALEKEPARSRPEGPEDILVELEGGEDEHSGLGECRVGDDLARRLEPGHLWHPHVPHHHVTVRRHCRLEGLTAARRLADDLEVGVGLEERPEPGADNRLVLGDQDPDPLAHVAALPPSGSRAWTRQPSATGPASMLPPGAPARSGMPRSPCPGAAAALALPSSVTSTSRLPAITPTATRAPEASAGRSTFVSDSWTIPQAAWPRVVGIGDPAISTSDSA